MTAVNKAVLFLQHFHTCGITNPVVDRITNNRSDKERDEQNLQIEKSASGHCSGYKQERIPGQIWHYYKTRLAENNHKEDQVCPHSVCLDNSRQIIIEMDDEIDLFVEDISRLVDMNVPPQYTVKLKNELGTIDRLSHRVKTIAETSFIPAAYAISKLAAAEVIILLFFVKLDPLYEGLALFIVLCMLLTALLLLIKDMDNPFEVGWGGHADIDLFLLFDLEIELAKRQKSC
jgi:hypothetical protein